MIQTGRQIAAKSKACSHEEMPIDLITDIILLLGQIQQPAPDAGSLVELAPVEVEGGDTL